jgi:hypothetical protein
MGTAGSATNASWLCSEFVARAALLVARSHAQARSNSSSSPGSTSAKASAAS